MAGYQDLSDVILELPMPDYLLCCSPYLCPGRVESTRRLSQNLSVLGGVDGSGREYLGGTGGAEHQEQNLRAGLVTFLTTNFYRAQEI